MRHITRVCVAVVVFLALSSTACDTTFKKVFQSFSHVKFANTASQYDHHDEALTVQDCQDTCYNDGDCIAFTHKQNADNYENSCYFFYELPEQTVPATLAHQTFVKTDVSF